METIVWLGFVLLALPATGEVIVLKPGDKASLSCSIARSNADQTWYHEMEQIFYINAKTGFSRKGPAAMYTRSRVLHDGRLLINSVIREDAGEFTCQVAGKSEKHTLLVITVSANPSTPQAGSTARLQCEVNGLKESPSMQWKDPNGATHPGMCDLSPVAFSHMGTWTCMFSHNGQEYSETLAVTVKGPPTTPPPTTTTQAQKNNGKATCSSCGSDSGVGQLSWWMWTAIGGGCLMVLLLVVFVIVLCKRIRRKKRMRTRQPLRPKQYCQCNQPTAARKPQQGRKKGKPSAPPLPLLLKE